MAPVIALTALAFLTLPMLGTPAALASVYYVSPAGNDANDCLTLATACQRAQVAVDKMPMGGHSLLLAPGTYNETVSITHTNQVKVTGPVAANNTCVDPGLVTITGVWVQDHATSWIQCLTTEAIRCRQWAIIDAQNFIFSGSADGGLAAQESCRINTDGKVWISGSVPVFARADNYSTIYLGAEVIVTQPNVVVDTLLAAEDSTLDLRQAKFSGFPLAAGKRFYLDNSTIVFPAEGAAAIPGSGSTAVNNSRCRPCAP